MKLVDKPAFTFDDVLLQPQYTEIKSRSEVSLKTRLTKNIDIDIPIVSANMDTVTEGKMASAIGALGGRGFIHRFMTSDQVKHEVLSVLDQPYSTISVGVAGKWREYLNKIFEQAIYAIDSVCIDVAHGDCGRMIDVLNFIKSRKNGNIDVICGNVATKEATERLCSAGADAIKVGIGPGSMCTTRIITGCGVPQLTAIMECSEAADKYNVPVIADGGIRNSGDIVKALAAGADSVMIGNLFAGTDESPGVIQRDIDGNKFKIYRGMASKDAMMDWKGKTYKDVTPEGEITYVPYKGAVGNIIKDLYGGIRSGMTYNNARTINELQQHAVFRIVSSNTGNENRAHGLK